MSWISSSIGKLITSLFDNPNGANSTQLDVTHTVVGGGRAGVSDPSTTSQAEYLINNYNRRGITQTRGGVMFKHAIGDAAGGYWYVKGSWGVAAGSDEGATAFTGQVVEDSACFAGTTTTTSTGSTTPVLVHSSGANYTVDGGYLLNISKGTLNGTLTGATSTLSLTINSGSVATFLNFLTVTGGTTPLPVSTAIGIATAAITPALTTRDVPVPVTITVNLAQIGGIYHLFTNGSVVSVAGINAPEQSIVSGASGLLAGNQQTFTLNVTHNNSQAIIFQGGIQGQYISADANLTLPGVRSAYFGFGSLTGTDLIYGNQVAGSLSSRTLPNLGCEAWTATGANSAWHLYPGAEVVKNTDSNFACQVEQNGVAWTSGDVVEATFFPTQGGATLFAVRQQYSPSNASFGMSGVYVLMEGPGTSGAGTAGIVLNNTYTPANYSGSGGPLTAIAGLKLLGQLSNPIYIDKAPDAANNAVIFVQNNNTAASNTVVVIELNWAGGGNMTFDVAAGRWHVDKMDSGAFSTGGVAGGTHTAPLAKLTPGGTNGSITFSNGLFMSAVDPT